MDNKCNYGTSLTVYIYEDYSRLKYNCNETQCCCTTKIFGFKINIESKKTERKKENKVFLKKKEHLEFESVLLLTKSTHLVTGIATDAILMTAVLRTLL